MIEELKNSRAGFIIAGGESSRMGTNKAFLEYRGTALLARSLTTLKASCGRVTIVGDPATFSEYGPVVADIFPGCGPLAGIHSALAHSAADLNVMLAVDMPLASAELLDFLLNAASASGAIVTVPRTRNGFQPLCAVYRREFVATAESAIREGKYKIDSAFASTSVRAMDDAELAAAGFSELNFFNVNTPDDLLAAERLDSQS